MWWAADDSIMPQTKEAINHAQVGRCTHDFAINKKLTSRVPILIKYAKDFRRWTFWWKNGVENSSVRKYLQNGQEHWSLVRKSITRGGDDGSESESHKRAVGGGLKPVWKRARLCPPYWFSQERLKIGDIMLAGSFRDAYAPCLTNVGKRWIGGPSHPVKVLGLRCSPGGWQIQRVAWWTWGTWNYNKRMQIAAWTGHTQSASILRLTKLEGVWP